MLKMTEVVTGKNTRFSYLNATAPRAAAEGATPKYSASLIISKGDTITLEKIKAAIKAAYEKDKDKIRGNSKVAPPLDKVKTPLRDGDEDKPDDEAYANSYFINATSKNKPKAFDANGNAIIDASELYSGIYGKAVINFYGYCVNGNRGIAAGLEGLQKLRDGEPLGGGGISADIFSEGSDEGDDDDSFLN